MTHENMSKLLLQDVLAPKLVNINNGCYRINRKSSTTNVPKPEPRPMKSYTDFEEIRCEDIHDFDIEITENGRFKTYISIPQNFYSYIIGTRGSRRKKIEEETKTSITIPKNVDNNRIRITGPNERSIVSARRRIEMIAIDLRAKHQITHFISFPLTNDEIKINFNKFKDLIVSGEHIDGVDASIFQKVDKLHLTIGTFVLLDNSEIDEISEMLDNCKKDVVDPILNSTTPLKINVKGLEYMNDDPSHVDVLFAKVSVENHKDPNILQRLSDSINNYFSKSGLFKQDSDHVKLHVTLMNSRYRKDTDTSDSQERNKRFKRVSFDARPILKKFGDFDFGKQEFKRILLSHRFSSDTDGYYETVNAISCCV